MKLLHSLLAILLLLILCDIAVAAPEEGPSITGQITGIIVNADGTPFGDGVVSFFPVEIGSPVDGGVVRRIPAHVIRLEPGGSFKAELSAGSYYIGAMNRPRGKGPGPPRAGEKFLFVLDHESALRPFAISPGQIVSAGEISGGIPETKFNDEDVFIAKGKVTYEDSRPYVGAMVTVKRDLSSSRPLFISEPTDANGRFLIKLPAGIYYFAAIGSIQGGRPGPGSFLGGYGEGSPVKEPEKNNVYPAVTPGKKENYIDGMAVQGKAGEVNESIDITMYSMPDPVSIRKERREEANALPTDQKAEPPQQ